MEVPQMQAEKNKKLTQDDKLGKSFKETEERKGKNKKSQEHRLILEVIITLKILCCTF